jgi:hypothetical protein
VEVLQGSTTAGVYQATISMQELQNWREKFPAWMDADAFTLQ